MAGTYSLYTTRTSVLNMHNMKIILKTYNSDDNLRKAAPKIESAYFSANPR